MGKVEWGLEENKKYRFIHIMEKFLKLLKEIRILYSIISKYMKTEKQTQLFCKGKDLLHEEKLSEFLDVLYELRTLCRTCNKSKSYFYGITITRNPKEQSVEQFVKYAEKFKTLKTFRESVSYEYGYESFNKEKEPINEHVHIFVNIGKYFSIKDFKKSFKHRIDVNRLYGESIYQTANYVKKDNNCATTIAHFKPYLETHFGSKEL